MKKNIFTAFFLSLFCLSLSLFPSSALAGEPTNQVKQTVDAVLEVLRNKELKKPDKTEQRRAQIRKIVSERFDFGEMAKRSLAQNWKKRTPEEQKEFVALYTDLLENTYIRKIEKYQDEKIVYGEEKIEGNYASLKTSVITTKEVEIPIEYRLLREGNQWRAYDVVIEGVSLVNNYRNQFNSILRSGSYEDLVKRLKNKTLKEPT
ncbi:MAG: ABC transporter substrate-binding protein [Nitrospirae bacterium]|nr:ABC transporter substrate-binding protein [Nitrospirota bacterium]MCL5422397.1 ABC transporter substrate-binding protein [Nitrospirota bacterium]